LDQIVGGFDLHGTVAGEDVTILYRRPDRSRGGVRVTRAEFLRAMDGFLQWFEIQRERLSPKE